MTSGLGFGAGSLLLPSLLRGEDHGGGPPRRLLFVFTRHGTVYDQWRMTPAGGSPEGDWGFDLNEADPGSFSPLLEALHPHRDQLLVLDGLSLTSALGDRPQFSPHTLGHIHGLTGAPIVPIGEKTATSTAASIDQRIAPLLARPGQLPSVEYWVGESPTNTAIWDASGSPVPSEPDPITAHARLFTDGDPDPGPAATLRRRVLARVRDRYSGVAASMSARDRLTFEAHSDLLRDLEDRLGKVAVDCGGPKLSGSREGDSEGVQYEADAEAFFQILRAAFSCDLTRVASLQLTVLPNELCDAPAGEVHNDFAHQVHQSDTARQVMINYGLAHARHVARLLDLFAQMPEGDGTLLDHTTVVWVNEMGDGAHDMRHWPTVIAGGDAFRLGRYLYWARTRPIPVLGPDPESDECCTLGVPHNRLLVTLCRQFGLEIDSVGSESVLSWEGVPIDLTGGLDRVI
jgi:hypothetical protein